MALVTREEFSARLVDHIGDEQIRLGMLEDLADSWTDHPSIDWESDDNPYKGKYEDVYDRYTKRFMTSEGKPDGRKETTTIFEEVN